MAEAAKVKSLQDMQTTRAELAAQGKRLVQCHGCFDIVHPGHIRYLRFAKSLGDVLLITVSADAVVGKGFDRPYIPESLRMENLAALEFVDYVCLSEDDWAGPVLERFKPDVYVKGKEYETNRDPRFAREKEMVERHGGSVVFGSGDVVFSSTEIINRYSGQMRLDHERLQAYCRQHQLTADSVMAMIDRFRGLRVSVLGDPILDHYVHCEGATVASEAPVLSVSPLEEYWFVGGGGIIAKQMAALGAEVTYFTAGAEGPEMQRLREGLAHAGVDMHNVEVDSRPVYVKTRYLVGAQKLLKVNRGLHSPIPADSAVALRDALAAHSAAGSAVVVTDFGYGLVGEQLAVDLADLSERSGRPYYADVSTNGRANLLKFRRPRLVTPTEQELRFALADAESGLSHLASRYYHQTGAHRLVVTMGERGALLFEPAAGDGQPLRTTYLPALESRSVDSVGAGDMFLSGMVLSDLSGAPLSQGLYLASVQAALSILTLGNESVGIPEIRQYLASRPELAAG